MAAGFAAADVVVEETLESQRLQHAHLETHCAIGWRDEDGRLVIRSSTQVPFLTRDALATVLGLPREGVRVFTGQVGGGFGGKQEMLVEDIVGLAVLKTGRPVQLELTREEQFAATTSRHPMKVRVKRVQGQTARSPPSRWTCSRTPGPMAITASARCSTAATNQCRSIAARTRR